MKAQSQMISFRKANLKILKVKVPLGIFRAYHDDGYVDSITGHRLMLDKRYRSIPKDYDPKREASTIGQLSRRIGAFFIHYHIYYLDSGYAPLNIATRAHEELHFAEHNKSLDLVAQAILERQKVRINFGMIDGYELRADIASVYALFEHGMHPDMLKKKLDNQIFYTAKRIYEQSRANKTYFLVPGP